MNKANDKSRLDGARLTEAHSAFTNSHTFRQHRLAFCVSAAIGMMASSAGYANPTGAQVVTGTVQFANPAPGQLNVTNTPGAVINWNQFSVGANETTRFIQQSAASAVLNRVTGPDISQILGNLQSNGRVFLINNNGVVFGQNSVVDTAGFVASTLDMSNDDFRAGKYRFTNGENSGDISNQGIIRAGEGGNVILIAPHIENGGVVEVTGGGNIVLAAGKSLTLTSWENPTVQFEVQAPEDSVINLGKVLADGGAARIFAGSVRHSGEIRADGVRIGSDGAIEIFAQADIELSAGSVTRSNGLNGANGGRVHVESATGTTTIAGQVSVDSDQAEAGQVELLGDYIQLASTGRVSANGETGGGTVLIGGDYKGGGSVKNASTLTFERDAIVSADAISSGNGGKVILWSDDHTEAFGSISAKGGALLGDGGFIEVSGKAFLRYDARVDTSAANGALGTTLLDPLDTCVTNATDCVDTGVNDGVTDLVDPGSSVITASSISGQAANTNFVIDAQNLEFEEAVNLTNAGAGIEARATGGIRVGATITTNGGSVLLSANDATGGTALGIGGILVLNDIATNGGNITLSSLNSTNGIAYSAAVNAGTGDVLINVSANSNQQTGGSITAERLVLNIESDDAINFNLGNAINRLNVSVASVTSAASGSFALKNTSTSLTVDELSYGGADTGYMSSVDQTGDLLFSSVPSSGSVNLVAGDFMATATGSILDADVDNSIIDSNIVLGSGKLTLNAGGRIGDQSGVINGALDLKVGTIAGLQSGTGKDIVVRNVGALDLNGTGSFSSGGKTVLISATDGGAASSISINSSLIANAGTLKLKADDLNINTMIDVNGQTVRFVPFTTGRGYSLGSTKANVTDIQLDQVELGRLGGVANAKIGPGTNDSQTVGDVTLTTGGIDAGGVNVFLDISGSVVFAQGAGNTGLATTGTVDALIGGGITGSGVATDIVANNLIVNTVSGIGTSGAVNLHVNSLDVTNTGAADILVVNENTTSPLTINRAVNSDQADRTISILNQTGDLLLAGEISVSGPNGSVSLTTGTNTSDGGAIRQIAGAVTASAFTALTKTGVATGADIDLSSNTNAIGQFSARSRARDNVTRSSGLLHLENATDVKISGLETTGKVDINAAGNLTQGTAASDAILAGEFNATTNNATPKNITFENSANDVATFNAATLNGDATTPAPVGGAIRFTDSNDLAIGPNTNAGAPSGLFTDNANGGSIVLTVGGNLTQDTISGISANTLTLNVQPNATVDLNPTGTAALDSNSLNNVVVNVGATGAAGSLSLTNRATDTRIQVAYSGTDSSYTATINQSGNLLFDSGANGVNLTNGNFVAIAGGDILDNDSDATLAPNLRLDNGTLSLSALGQIGQDPTITGSNGAFDTQVGTLVKAVSGVGKDIRIRNVGSLTLSGAAAGDIQSGGLLEIVSVANSANNLASSLTVNSVVKAAADLRLASDLLAISTNGSLTSTGASSVIAFDVATAGRFIDIGDGNSANLGDALKIDSAAIGKLTANEVKFGSTATGNITFTGNADFGSANVSAQTGGEIVFNHSVSSFGVKTTGNLALDASTSNTLGRIIGDSSSANLDIQANGLQITARNGIGPTSTAGDTNVLQTQVSSLAATTTNGDVRVDNSGALTINGVSAGGEVAITTASPLTVASSVSGGGNVLLQATAASVLTVNAGQSVSSNTGNVILEGNDLVLDGSASATSGTVFIRPTDNATAITVGGTGGFSVSAAELSRISAGTGVELGRSTHTGGIAVAGAIGGAASPFTAPKLTFSSNNVGITGQVALGATTILELLTTNGTGPTIAADITAGTINAVGQTFNVIGASTLTASSLNATMLRVASGTGDVNLNTPAAVQTLRVESGRLVLPGAVSLLTGQALELVGGSVKTNGDVTASSGARVDWGDGTLDATGTGNFIFDGGSTLNLTQTTGTKRLDGRSITMKGTTTLASTLNWISGDMEFSNGATVVNEAGSIANITGNNRKFQGAGTAGSWTNSGTVNKISTGTTQLEIAFNNLGTLNVSNGIFQLGQTEVSIGSVSTIAASTFVINPGATLRYSGGTHTFGVAGSTIASTASFSGGGLVELLGANWQLNESVVMDTPMLWSGGNISGPTPTAGSTQPPLEFAINATLTIDTGTTGATPIAGVSASNIQFTTQTGSGIVLTGSDTFSLNDSSLDIASGVIFDVQSDANISSFTGTTGTINNSGTFRKSVGVANSGGNTNVEVVFNNSGTVEGRQGELSFKGSGNDTGIYDVSSGAFVFLGQEVDPNAAIQPPAITRNLNADVQFTGAGTHVWQGNGINLNTDVTIASGRNLVFARANIAGSGTVTNNGALSIFGDSVFTSGTIANSGTLKFGDFALITDTTDPLRADASLQVASLTNTGNIELTNSDTAAHNFDLRVSGTLTNSGTITATTGTGGGARGIQGTVVNETSGVIDAKSIDLAISGNATGSITNRGNLNASGANLTLRDFSVFTQIEGAAVNVSSGRTFALIGNPVTGAGGSSSSFDWQGGDILGGGSWTNSNVNVSLAGSGRRKFNAITTAGDINNPGAVAIGGGSLEILGGSFRAINPMEVNFGATLIVNDGSFTVDNGLTINAGGTLMGSGAITGNVTNAAGTVAPGNSPGTLAISGDFTQGADGTLVFEVNGSNSGEFDQLKIGGTASLAGTLEIPPLPSTFVSDGTTLPLLTAKTISGDFTTKNIPSTLNLALGKTSVEVQQVVAPVEDVPPPGILPEKPPEEAGGDSGDIDSGDIDTGGDTIDGDAAKTASGSQDDGSSSDDSSDDGGGDGSQETADDFESDDGTGDDTGDAKDAGAKDGDKSKDDDGKDAKDGDKDEEDKDADKKKAKKKADKKKKVKKKKRKVEACK